MAKLPIERYKSDTISQMDIGESGYTTPWAMWVDESGNCFLNPNYTIGGKGGTFEMKVTRESKGYIVDLSECDATYQPVKAPFYIGEDGDFINIIKVII